jgi:hypothetical protein
MSNHSQSNEQQQRNHTVRGEKSEQQEQNTTSANDVVQKMLEERVKPVASVQREKLT